MGHLSCNVLEAEEVIWHLGRPSHFTGTVQTQHQQVHHKPIILDDEGSKLQTTNNPIGVCVIHVLRKKKCEKPVTIYQKPLPEQLLLSRAQKGFLTPLSPLPPASLVSQFPLHHHHHRSQTTQLYSSHTFLTVIITL